MPSAALLPDGRVLIANGENGGIDQAAFASIDAGADPRFVQIIDAEKSTVQTEAARSTVFRGYHNVLALLPSGALMTGGGFNQWGDVGCEEPNLNVFSPSYLAAGPRPSIVNAIIGMDSCVPRLQRQGVCF